MNPNELLEAIERIINGTEGEIEKKDLLAKGGAVDARLSAYHAIKQLIQNNTEVEDE